MYLNTAELCIYIYIYMYRNISYKYIRDMGIAWLNLKFNKKVKTNVESESIFIIKSHQTGPPFKKKNIFSDDKLQRLNK